MQNRGIRGACECRHRASNAIRCYVNPTLRF
jgi:hypothetical protein